MMNSGRTRMDSFGGSKDLKVCPDINKEFQQRLFFNWLVWFTTLRWVCSAVWIGATAAGWPAGGSARPRRVEGEEPLFTPFTFHPNYRSRLIAGSYVCPVAGRPARWTACKQSGRLSCGVLVTRCLSQTNQADRPAGQGPAEACRPDQQNPDEWTRQPKQTPFQNCLPSRPVLMIGGMYIRMDVRMNVWTNELLHYARAASLLDQGVKVGWSARCTWLHALTKAGDCMYGLWWRLWRGHALGGSAGMRATCFMFTVLCET